MMPRAMLALAAALGLVLAGDVAPQNGADPFAVFRSCVQWSGGERDRARQGKSVVRVLPGRDRDVAIAGMRRTTAGAERLVAWTRRIDLLKKSSLVTAIGRFSNPPQLADLAGLELDEDDLSAIRRCRPSDCGVKLTAAEIARFQQVIARAGDGWRPLVQEAFRRMVLDRLRAYVEGGQAAIERYADGRTPRPLDAVFAELVDRTPCVAANLPDLARALTAHASDVAPPFESFFYWSKERFHGTPVVIVTHVVISRASGAGGERVVDASRQVFATHYMNGSLNLTALVPAGDGARYLLILNRTNVDVLHGVFGGIARGFIERRLESQLADILGELANRLESGPPVQ